MPNWPNGRQFRQDRGSTSHAYDEKKAQDVNPVNIRPADLIIVQDILRTFVPAGSRVWVFGSRIKGTTKQSSDLDLAIDAARPLSRQESATMPDAFEESDLPYKVDLVDLQSVSEPFKAIIERDKVPLPGFAE
jgi:predicted nucleotidyltransferase